MATNRLKRAFGASLLLSMTSIANAATITHEKPEASTESVKIDVDIIRIDGDIAAGDLERFRQISLRVPKAVVVLNSNGGLIHLAIEIGKIIKIAGYDTAVASNEVCASACALIWMAGNRRILLPSGRVGFHASYRNNNGRPVESGAANALVGNYLTLLGASAKTVVFATTAPPDRVLWLTTANKDAAGIDFETTGAALPQGTRSRLGLPPVLTVLPPALVPSPQGPANSAPSDTPLRLPQNWQWSNAPTAPWVLISSSSEGNKYYINQNSFKQYENSGSGWEFWSKIEFSSGSNGNLKESLSLTQINCESITIRSTYYIEYEDSGKIINSIFDEDYTSNKFLPISPNSMGQSVYRAVCRAAEESNSNQNMLPEGLSENGESWVEVGYTGTNIWYDLSSIKSGISRRDGRVYKHFWVLYNNYNENDKENISYSLVRKAISCQNDKIGDAEAVFILKNGKKVHREPAFRTRSILPGTIDKTLHRLICN